MTLYWPARPTWRAESTLRALVQLGYPPEKAEDVLAAAVIDGTDKCLFLYRDDQPTRCDVVMTMPEATGIDAVVVMEVDLELQSHSYEEAIAKWPFNGSLWVVASNLVERRPS